MPNADTLRLFLRYSPLKRVIASIVSFAIAVGGYALTRFPIGGPAAYQGPKLRIVGWMFVVVCGLGGLIAVLLALFHRGVAVEIDERGILNRRGGWPLIAWEDIRCVTVRLMTLEIQPLHPEKLKSLPFDGLTLDISLAGLSPSEAEVSEYLARHHTDRYQKS